MKLGGAIAFLRQPNFDQFVGKPPAQIGIANDLLEFFIEKLMGITPVGGSIIVEGRSPLIIPDATLMPQRRRSKSTLPLLTWQQNTELVGVQLTLQPLEDFVVPPHYTTELHSWWLDQVRRMDFALSTDLHDGQSEKPFTISQLKGEMPSQGRSLRLLSDQMYRWQFTALSQPVIDWVNQWLTTLPTEMRLRSGTLKILNWAISHPPITYAQLLKSAPTEQPTMTLSFLSPASFRRKGNHLPLPLPLNVFHSYLRRWNDFSSKPVNQEDFLDWVDGSVVLLRHHLQSAKVMAGKSGSVTGFTGSVQFGIASKARRDTDYIRQWLALGELAPYCGTGHKTTFGLGETVAHWLNETATATLPTVQHLLAQRIDELTEVFIAQRQRVGGDRATQIAVTWATILARRELGESLQAIAQDLEMPYETVKTYSKLARRALRS